MVIYFNLLSDINNFKVFILEIENIVKEISEKQKSKPQKNIVTQ